MRSRRCSGYGWPSGDTRGSGRRVTCKAPSAHVEGGSGRPEASPTAILQDTHSVEGKFCEHLQNGVLGSYQAPLLPDNGNWAVSVPNHGLRYATHKRPP
jgi:hypothetical protein